MLGRIAAEVEPWPQLMINVKVPNDEAALQQLPGQGGYRCGFRKLGNNGGESWFARPVRKALVRVMVERRELLNGEQVDAL